MEDSRFMAEALALAKEAADEGEVPVGCVITLGDQIVGRGRNRREAGKSALAHAEIEAIDQACRTLGGWRLWECTLYVTLEPCAMCIGACALSKIDKVYFGAYDTKSGACGGKTDVLREGCFDYKTEIFGGIEENECKEIDSFVQRAGVARKNKKKSHL